MEPKYWGKNNKNMENKRGNINTGIKVELKAA